MAFFGKSKKQLYFTIVVILIVVLHYLGVLSPMESLLSRTLSPVLSRSQAIGSGLSSLYHRQAGQGDLAERLSEVSAENERLIAENARLKVAEAENQVLREQLKFLSDGGYKHVTANVISRGGISFGPGLGTLIIDRGRLHGVTPGMAVVSGPGLVVGKVKEVRDRSSLVDLITNDNCRFAAMSLSDSRTSGVAEGELDLSVRMDFIPLTNIIVTGDTIVTSGLEETVPRGLVIGRVSSIERSNNDLWQSAVISPLANLDELIIVSVVLPLLNP